MNTHATSRLTPRTTTLAVFAPFGADAVLSGYPDGRTRQAADHPIVARLQEVAATGVDVLLLIDRLHDDTHLVRITPGATTVEAAGKLDMRSPHTLADFIALAQRHAPDSKLVLTIEGHGAGFVPELDRDELARLEASASDHPYEWREEGGVMRAYHRRGERAGHLVEHRGAPVLPGGNPTLPGGNPTLPDSPMGMSTWAMGEALRLSGVPKLAVIHFNNCFNMSVEVLHTVAPHAEVATGYCNYNFFSAGQAYPAVFERLAAGGATPLQAGCWFAEENHRVLHAAGREPTVAGTVELARMAQVAAQVDALSDALLELLRGASAADRPRVVAKIRQAIRASQQYDANGDDVLDAPDELTDLDSLAAELMAADFGSPRVAAAADGLRSALSGIKQYGDVGSPWMAPGVRWDFSSENLAMNIFLPDPLLNGLWDWRSQYYLDVNPDTTRPQPQRRVIDFLKETDWVDFLLEYHRDTPLAGLRRAEPPRTPVVHAPADPRRRRART
jgi:hypothetical protein